MWTNKNTAVVSYQPEKDESGQAKWQKTERRETVGEEEYGEMWRHITVGTSILKEITFAIQSFV